MAAKGTEMAIRSDPESFNLYIPEKPVKYCCPALSIKFTIPPVIRNPEEIAEIKSQIV